VPIKDEALQESWGERLFRISLEGDLAGAENTRFSFMWPNECSGKGDTPMPVRTAFLVFQASVLPAVAVLAPAADELEKGSSFTAVEMISCFRKGNLTIRSLFNLAFQATTDQGSHRTMI